MPQRRASVPDQISHNTDSYKPSCPKRRTRARRLGNLKPALLLLKRELITRPARRWKTSSWSKTQVSALSKEEINEASSSVLHLGNAAFGAQPGRPRARDRLEWGRRV